MTYPVTKELKKLRRVIKEMDGKQARIALVSIAALFCSTHLTVNQDTFIECLAEGLSFPKEGE